MEDVAIKKARINLKEFIERLKEWEVEDEEDNNKETIWD